MTVCSEEADSQWAELQLDMVTQGCLVKGGIILRSLIGLKW